MRLLEGNHLSGQYFKLYRMQIGQHIIKKPLVLSPMAGITDRPFRQLCKKLGAGMTVSEMVSSNPDLLKTQKTKQRLNHDGEKEPRIVQIAGADPIMMANAARYNTDNGAQIIDINMGCPAKKVCNAMAGSALMGDEKLVSRILTAVVNAVDVPVTLKMRTGLNQNNKNSINIAKIAEDSGIAALTIHGRTREDRYRGDAEYDTIAKVKQKINLPVFANGDITTPEKAKFVLDYTQADGLFIGRAAQGYPWIFREIDYFLKTGKKMAKPSLIEIRSVILEHLHSLYEFYGEYMGVRIARKHIGWYMQILLPDNHKNFRKTINKVENTKTQYQLVSDIFFHLTTHEKNLMSQGNIAA